MSRITARAISNGYLALFAGCALLLHRDALTSSLLFAESDTYEFYAPLARLFGDALHAGHMVWWTNTIYGGYPLFADGETAMLYPPHLLYAVAPPVVAFLALRVFTYVVASWSMFCFCRSLDQSTWASTLGGLSFGFGSFCIGQMQHVNLLDCAALLPLVLANHECAVRRAGADRLRCAALAGGVCGLQALTPHSAVLLITALATTLYLVLRLVIFPMAPPRTARPSLGARVLSLLLILGTTGLLGGMIGAIQLLPLASLAAESQRGEGVTYAYATAFAFPPPNLLTLLWPYFFRAGDGTYWSPWFRWDTTLYAGVAPLVLAYVALVVRRPDGTSRSREFALALVGFLGLLVAFGDLTPLKLFGGLWHLPIFSTQRAPSRYLLLSGIALAALAGFGLDRVAMTIATKSFRASLRALVLMMMTGFGVLTTTFLLVARHPDAARRLLLAPYAALASQQTELHATADPLAALTYSLRPTSRWTATGLLMLAATLLLFTAWRRWQTKRPIWQTTFVALSAFDLLVFAHDFHPMVPFADVWGLSPAGYAIAASGANRTYTVWPAAETAPDKLAPFGLQDAAGYTSLEPAGHAALTNALRAGNPIALDLLGVEAVVVPTRARAQNTADELFYADTDVTILRRPDNHPRAWFVADAKQTSQNDALLSVTTSSFDVYKTVLLETGASGAELGARGPALAGSKAVSRTIVLDDRGDVVRMRVAVPVPGWLVLADLWYPGWTATVDGVREPVLRADGLVRAIALPPGDHSVIFAYREPWLTVGATMSLSGIALMLLFLRWQAKTHSEKRYS